MWCRLEVCMWQCNCVVQVWRCVGGSVTVWCRLECVGGSVTVWCRFGGVWVVV